MPALLRANPMRQMLIAAIAISFAGRAADNNFASRVDVIARHSLEAPFVHAINRDTMVRFIQRRGHVDLAFVYTAGLMMDGKRRTR